MKTVLYILSGVIITVVFFLLTVGTGFYIGRVFSAIECREYGVTSVAGITVSCETLYEDKPDSMKTDI